MRRLKNIRKVLALASWSIWLLIIAQIWSSYDIWQMLNDHDMASPKDTGRSIRYKTPVGHYVYHHVDSIPAQKDVRYFSAPYLFIDYVNEPVQLVDRANLEIPLLFNINPGIPLQRDPMNRVFLTSEGFYLIFLILFFLILRWLVEMFKRMEQEGFFGGKHHRHIRRIGANVMAIPIVGEVARRIVFSIVSNHSMMDSSLGELYMIPEFDFPIFFVGMSILVISEAFKYGLILQEDQQLTI